MDPKQFTMTRRRLLRGTLMSAASYTLSGCCLRRRLFPPCEATPESAFPKLTIDAHCHIFNGSDLDMKKFLGDIVFKEKGIPEPISGAAAAILQDLVWGGAATGDEELRLLQNLGGCGTGSARNDLLKRHRAKKYH